MSAVASTRGRSSAPSPSGGPARAHRRVWARASCVAALAVAGACSEAGTTGGVKPAFRAFDLDAAGFVVGADGPSADGAGGLAGSGRWLGALPLDAQAAGSFSGSERFVAWTAELPAAAALSLAVRGSGGLDTVMLVYGPANAAGRFGARPLAQDDDGAGGIDPRLTHVAASRAGTYAVVVAPYDTTARGRFVLDARCTSGCDAEPAGEAEARLDRARAQLGDRVEVTLENGGGEDLWLDACAPFVLERWDAAAGAWGARGEGACDGSDDAALRVPAGERHTEGWRPDEPGRFRAVFEAGLGCDDGEPLARARCAQWVRFETAAIDVEAGDGPGEPLPGDDEPVPSGEAEPPRGEGACSADNDCVVTGCNDEVCGAQAVETSCGALDVYACLQHTRCGCVAGRCDWAPTFAWRTCMDNAGR